MKELLRNLKCKRETFIRKNHIELYNFINQYNSLYGDISFPQKVFNLLNDYKIPKQCICGNILKFHNGKYTSSCSIKCANRNPDKIKSQLISHKETIQRKYGVDSVFEIDSVQEKIKKTFNDNWGVNHISESKELMDKAKNNMHKRNYKEANKKRQKTCLDKYGVDNIAKSEQSTINAEKTSLKRYNVTHYSKTDEYSNRVKETMLSKYNIEHLMMDAEYVKKVSIARRETMENKWIDSILEYNKEDIFIDGNYDTKNIEFKCVKCGEHYNIIHYLLYQRYNNNHTICTICNNPKHNRSSQLQIQREIYDFIIESTQLDIIENYIYSKENKEEIDIFIPDKHIGIEVNGLYWHSELYREKNFHINKTENCNNHNINLFHVWEDDWLYKKDIIKSMLLNKIGYTEHKIYARKCIIKEVNSKDSRLFLNENHLQGYVSAKHTLGLFYNDVLVSLMSFGNLRKSLGQTHINEHYELLRFCNKLNHSVVGGASKLFKHFIKQNKIEKIISYSNLDFGYTDFYSKLGFSYIRNTVCGYSYIVNGVRENRFKYRKDKLVSEGHDINMTEHEIMSNQGYHRIYNCGNQYWEYVLI